MNPIQDILDKLSAFTAERDWDQFHDGKNLALALGIEAAELNEAFLWKTAEEADPAKVREELADVFLCAFMLANKYHLDVHEICLEKIARNAAKYPVDKARGSTKKYTEFS